MGYYNAFVKTFGSFSRLMNYLGTGFLVLMMLITVLDVLGRYILNRPLSGSLELIEYTMVVVGTLGLGWCTLQGRHLTVDLVVAGLPPRVQNIIDIITHCLCLSAYSLLSWQAVLESTNSLLIYEDVSDVLEIPVYPFFYLMSFGFIMLGLAILVRLIELLKKAVKP